MAKRSVTWTATALAQRREILKYWTIRNGSTTYAEKLLKLTRERLKIIANHPYSGKVTKHPGTRHAAMGNFSIFYKIVSDQIVVTAFWDNRQDPEKLLELILRT